jgi:hypothetical protein
MPPNALGCDEAGGSHTTSVLRLAAADAARRPSRPMLSPLSDLSKKVQRPSHFSARDGGLSVIGARRSSERVAMAPTMASGISGAARRGASAYASCGRGHRLDLRAVGVPSVRAVPL